MNWLKRWRGEKMGKPKIRFKGYTEDWEQRKLSDIYGSIGNAFVGTATPYYAEQGHFYLESNNVKDGQINHNSEVFINDEFYEKQKDKWLHTGDMVMVQSGHVGHAAVISEELDNTAAHALIMFRNPKEEIEPYFLNYEYQTDKAKKKIENITTGNTIKHILASDMQEFVVDVPKYEEQKVIADYFRNLDHLITLHQRKCDETKKLKKCMLQKMFPKEGEKVPEIRFSGFTGDWKQRKLGDVAEIIGGGTPKTSINDYWDGEINWYAPAEIGNLIYVSSSQRKITKLGLNKSSAKILPVGTVLFTSRAGIGKTAILACEGCTNQGFQSIVPRKGMLDSYFIFVRTEELKRYAETVGAGSTFVEVSGKQMTDMELMLPITIEEQQKIGNYFAEIDSLITFHQQRCDELKNIKKFMLQNMFVSEK
mgnify:CR=1 FL=1